MVNQKHAFKSCALEAVERLCATRVGENNKTPPSLISLVRENTAPRRLTQLRTLVSFGMAPSAQRIACAALDTRSPLASTGAQSGARHHT